MSGKNDNSLLNTLNEHLKGRPVKLDEKDIKRNPASYSLFSKLIRSRNEESFKNNGQLTDTTPSLDYLLGMASDKAQDIDDNEAIMQLLPDLQRAAQILISYVLSPTYITSGKELQYLPPPGLFTQSSGVQMVDRIKNYMATGFNLDGRLYDIMYKILFTKGAYCVAVIPESSLDELINPELAKESFSYQTSKQSITEIDKQLDDYMRPCVGFAGKKTETKKEHLNSLSTESYSINFNSVEVTSGNTDGSSPTLYQTNNTTTSNNPVNQLIDTRIKVGDKIEYEFPKEIFDIDGAKKDKKDTEITLSKEGKWTVNLNGSGNETFIEYTDDLNMIRLGHIRKEATDKRIKGTLGLSRESYTDRTNASDRQILDKVFKNIDSFVNSGYGDDNNLKILKNNRQTYRKDLNEPLVIEYPVESIIPIYKPGTPSEHVGYLVLHDEEGAPLSKVKPVNYYRDLSNTFNSRTSGSKMASSLIQQGREMFDGMNSMIDEARQIEMLSRIHGNAIIKEIIERTRQGEYGKNLDIGDSTEAFRIMFYRALAGQRTRVLFMPKDIMTYMAQDFDNKGMGRSLIDNMKVLLSLRIQFMLAQVRAGIANSIPETVATVRIDEKDPDPKKTIQIAQALTLKTRLTAGLMVGASNVQTIEDRINQSNIRLAIESDHPKVPNIGHDITRNTADIPVPDNDTAELINRLVQMGTFLPPELVDNSYGVDFAREVLQQNFLVGMVVKQIQTKQNPYFTEFVKKLILASPTLRTELKETVKSNLNDILDVLNEASDDEIDKNALSDDSLRTIIEYITDKFIAGLVVKLPEKANDNDEMINDQISKMEARIDKTLDYIYSPESLPNDVLGEEAANFIDQYRGLIKAEIMRNFLIESGFGTEVMDFITVSDDGVQTYEKNASMRDFAIKTIKNMMDMFEKSKNIVKSTEGFMEGNDLKPSEGGGSYDSGDSSGDSEDGGDDDGFGDFGDEGGEGGEDDFNFDEGGEGGEGEGNPSDSLDGAPD